MNMIRELGSGVAVTSFSISTTLAEALRDWFC
jgi:hypothetical protein